MKNEENDKIKLGIIGSGRIAKRFVEESRYVNSIAIKGNYNPNIKSAKKFADTHNLDFYTDSLQELFEKVDAIYIASPHDTHYQYIKQALYNKKHTLCEKPMVLNRKEAEEVYSMADNSELVLMEALKTAYCPGFNSLLSLAKNGIVGDVVDVEASFTKLEEANNRELTDYKCGGSFTELASYTLLPIVKIFGTEYKEICYKFVNNDKGVDIYTKLFLDYTRGLATSKTGLGVKSEGEMIISGTKGYIIVNAPWWKTTDFEVRYEDQSKNEKYHFEYLGDGLRYEIGYFVNSIRSNNLMNLKVTSDESIWLADMMEKFLSFHRKE